MVTPEMVSELSQGKRPSFMFVCEGKIQHWKADEQKNGMIVATTREAANTMAADLTARTGKTVSVAELGTVPGQMLGNEIARSISSQGATGVFVTEDGKENYFFNAVPKD